MAGCHCYVANIHDCAIGILTPMLLMKRGGSNPMRSSGRDQHYS